MFKNIIEEVRKQVPTGEVDVKVEFIGEYVSSDEEQTSYDGRYVCEIRFDENNEIVENYTCVRSFVTDDGEEFDPQIATSEMDDFEYYTFEIKEVELAGK